MRTRPVNGGSFNVGWVSGVRTRAVESDSFSVGQGRGVRTRPVNGGSFNVGRGSGVRTRAVHGGSFNVGQRREVIHGPSMVAFSALACERGEDTDRRRLQFLRWPGEGG